jgi:acetylglutamate kinase
VIEVTDDLRASILLEALPYIQRFRSAIIVVKYGGNVFAENGESLESLAKDVALMSSVGMKPVLVHGGGPQIDEVAKVMGVTSTFVDGLRVTDEKVLEAVKLGLLGVVNPTLVKALNGAGARAIGVSGIDDSFALGAIRDDRLGFVGDIISVKTEVLESILEAGMVPVVASLAVDKDGQILNVNADTYAAAVAVSLGATRLIYLSNVAGILRDINDPASLMSVVSDQEVESLIAEGVVTKGMIPKLLSAKDAVAGGVEGVHLLDGRIPHSLLLELFTDRGVGTMIVKRSL